MESNGIHNYLRTSIPGTIFFLVLLSLLLPSKELAFSVLKEWDSGLLGLIFSIAAGTIIQWIEQESIHRCLERSFRKQQLGCIYPQGIPAALNGEDGERRASLAFAYILHTDKKFEDTRDWLNFHFSSLHSLGGAFVAIISALFFAFLTYSQGTLSPDCVSTLVAVIGFWVMIILFILSRRQAVAAEIRERFVLFIDNHRQSIVAALSGRLLDLKQP